jgi:RNA recognition motif. (a.k.a. RRM, RBD, or RNP domain)
MCHKKSDSHPPDAPSAQVSSCCGPALQLLYDTFNAFGVIVQTPKIMRDPETGLSRGFGFVSYDSFEASDASIEAMNGQFLCNRQAPDARVVWSVLIAAGRVHTLGCWSASQQMLWSSAGLVSSRHTNNDNVMSQADHGGVCVQKGHQGRAARHPGGAHAGGADEGAPERTVAPQPALRHRCGGSPQLAGPLPSRGAACSGWTDKRTLLAAWSQTYTSWRQPMCCNATAEAPLPLL